MSLLCLTALLAVVVKTYDTRQTTKQHVALARHSALDVTLFPPLFFFSALYYTDVPSTLSVLVFYWFFLYSYRHDVSPWLRTSGLVLLGAASLLFRQTNIFWVAVFPAGIALVNELDRGHLVVKDSMHRRAEGFGDSMVSVVRSSWKMEVIFDPTVRDGWIEGTSKLNRQGVCLVNVALDYIKTIISIVASGMKAMTQPDRLTTLLIGLAPYMVLISMFAGFVLWNGGVVLGDKSNHVATIHLPQMLYIWPYFTFFSWPLLYPYLAVLPIALLAKMPNVAPLEGMLMFKRRHLAPRTWLLGLFIALACLIVHFNTIVHPFTLADNRHYNFYVFRLLMRPSWVKYAVTPIYIVCGWACIQALSARPLSATRPASSKNTNSAGSAQNPARPLALPEGTNSASDLLRPHLARHNHTATHHCTTSRTALLHPALDFLAHTRATATIQSSTKSIRTSAQEASDGARSQTLARNGLVPPRQRSDGVRVSEVGVRVAAGAGQDTEVYVVKTCMQVVD